MIDSYEQFLTRLRLHQEFHQKQLAALRVQHKAELRQAQSLGLALVDQLKAQQQVQVQRLRWAHYDEVRQLRRAYQDQVEALRNEERSREAREAARAQVAGAVAGQVQQTGRNLFNLGYSGTVLEAQMTYELKLLGRELVGVFGPLLRGIKQLVQSVRVWMQSLDEAGQNVIMFGGLALMASRFLGMFGLGGGALKGLLASMGIVGGVNLARGGGGGPAGGGGIDSMIVGGVASYGVYRGVRRFLAPPTAPTAPTAPAAPGAPGVPGAPGAPAAAPGAAGGSWLRRVGMAGLRGLTRLAMPLGVGLAGMEAYDMYKARRAAGESWLGAGLRSIAHGAVSFASLGLIDLYDRPDAVRVAAPGRRREAISGAGYDQLGGAYDAVNLAISRVQEPTERYLAEILETLRGAVAVAGRPEPPPLVAPEPRR